MIIDHRVSRERKCPYKKKLKGQGYPPCTLTIMTSYTNECQISVFNMAKENESAEEKISDLYTAKQNCLEADRLEINILVHKIIC